MRLLRPPRSQKMSMSVSTAVAAIVVQLGKGFADGCCVGRACALSALFGFRDDFEDGTEDSMAARVVKLYGSRGGCAA